MLGTMAVGRRRGQLACFGLDRISGLVVSEQAFTPPPGFDAASYYAHAFGIIRPGAAVPQEVVLRFWPEQGRYALHASQRLCGKARQKSCSPSLHSTPTTCAWSCSATASRWPCWPCPLRDWLQTQHAEAGNLQSIAL